MFDDFYDKATLKRATGADKFKATTFGPAESLSCRLVKTEDKLRTVSDKVTTIRQRKWHVPTNSNVKEKDTIDGFVVTEVRQGRGIGGTVHYLIVIGEK